MPSTFSFFLLLIFSRVFLISPHIAAAAELSRAQHTVIFIRMEIYGTKSVYYHVRLYNFSIFLLFSSIKAEILCRRYVEGNLIFFCRRVEFDVGVAEREKLGPKTLPLDTWKEEGKVCIMKKSWINDKIYWQFRGLERKTFSSFFARQARTWQATTVCEGKMEGKCHRRLQPI